MYTCTVLAHHTQHISDRACIRALSILILAGINSYALFTSVNIQTQTQSHHTSYAHTGQHEYLPNA